MELPSSRLAVCGRWRCFVTRHAYCVGPSAVLPPLRRRYKNQAHPQVSPLLRRPPQKSKHTLKYLLFSADLPKNPGTPSSISKRRYRYGLKRTKTDKYGPDGDNKTFACRLKHSGVQSVVAHKFSQQQVTGVIARKLAPRCYLPQSCAQGDYRYGLKRAETEVYRHLS